MTPASFSELIVAYADFMGQRSDARLGHDELEDIRRAVYRAFSDAEARNGRAKIDGLEAIEWIKKYRNDFGVSLREAKDEWDRRVVRARNLTV